MLIQDERPIIETLAIMNEVIRDVLCDEFAHGNTDSIVKTCQELGTTSSRLLADQPIVLNALCRVLHHDYGTFTHSANVSAYAQLLARALGFSTGGYPADCDWRLVA